MIENLYKKFLQYPAICTDTRKNLDNSLFFAIEGRNFDANNFVDEALEKGAAYVVTSNSFYKNEPKCLVVEDTLETLQSLAAFHRDRLCCDVIAVTGSSGKTTTKELIYRVLRKKYNTYCTEGNLNNHIGVPLTLLDINGKVEKAIIEMGANHVGEIDFLCHMAKPSHGLITNVGNAHVGEFGSLENIKKTKLELYDYLNKAGASIFFDENNTYLIDKVNTYHRAEIIGFGTNKNNIWGQVASSYPTLSIRWNKGKEVSPTCKTTLFGDYNLQNIIAAITIGTHFEVGTNEILNAIETYSSANQRSQILETDSNTVVCDYYNANPLSMSLGIKNFAGWEANNKVVIVGQMNELGESSTKEHQSLKEEIRKYNFEKNIFVGAAFYALKDEKDVFFQDVEACRKYLKEHPLKNKKIFIKGSRTVHLERVIETL